MSEPITKTTQSLLKLLKSNIDTMQGEIVSLGNLLHVNDERRHQLALDACGSALNVIRELSQYKSANIDNELPLNLDSSINDAVGDECLSVYAVDVDIFSGHDLSMPYATYTIAAVSDEAEDTEENVKTQAIDLCKSYFGSINYYSASGNVSRLFGKEAIDHIRSSTANKNGEEIARIVNTYANVYPQVFHGIHCEYVSDSTWIIDSKALNYSDQMTEFLARNLCVLSILDHEQFENAMSYFDENEVRLK